MAIQFKEVKCHKKIIAVDFDGTLLNNKYPLLENPNIQLIDWIKANRKKYIFILWTCREGDKLREAVDYMLSLGIRFDYVNDNARDKVEEFKNNSRKIYADYYIDDKNFNPL